MKNKEIDLEALAADPDNVKEALETLKWLTTSDPEKVAMNLPLMAIEKRLITLDQAAHIAAVTDGQPQGVFDVLAVILEKNDQMSPEEVQRSWAGKQISWTPCLV